jgi:tRNA1(Val) A37 N6-methylase TrmN6
MSIFNITKSDFKQNLSTDKLAKVKYGEIFTPFSLIEDILDLIPKGHFTDPNKKWLDTGAGTGYFSLCLFWKLDKGLRLKIPDKQERFTHIIENMIFMCEIRTININKLIKLFGNNSNIISGDFLNHVGDYDFVIGNPPYNSEGIRKVPTNKVKNKKVDDGKTIWIDFTKHAITCLKQDGMLVYIIPSIWMRPDRVKMYNFMMQYKINKLKCLTNTQTNRYFRGEAQTPTCYFCMTKKENDFCVKLYDRDLDAFVDYHYKLNDPLPVFGANIIKKLINRDVEKIICFKTNMPSKNASIKMVSDKIHKYKNIKTCILKKISPELIINYSDKPLKYHGKSKLVMAHKMYGFPFIDVKGEYGISNRDNYVILSDNIEYLERLASFFKTKTALYLFETTRYRMKYLEKEIFKILPDPTKLSGAPDIFTDQSIWNYFNFSETEIQSIVNLHSKNYNFEF